MPHQRQHSIGGRRGLRQADIGEIGLNTLAQAPDLFNRYLIMSPALWFDDGKIYDIALTPSERARAIFLAADTPRSEARSDMANNTLRLNDLLLADPSLHVLHALIVGESHNSMVAPAARRGLALLYGEATP